MSAFQVSADTIDLIVSAALLPEDGTGRGELYATFPLHTIIRNKDLEAAGRVIGNYNSGYRIITIGEELGTALGQELITQNVASLAERYSDVKAALKKHGWRGGRNPMVTHWPADYTYRPVKILAQGDSPAASYAEVLGALACYEYQASEANNYLESSAGYIVAAVRRKIAGLIASGYWEYNREENYDDRY